MPCDATDSHDWYAYSLEQALSLVGYKALLAIHDLWLNVTKRFGAVTTLNDKHLTSSCVCHELGELVDFVSWH